MKSSPKSQIGPERSLPYCDDFKTTEDYVSSLLSFVGSDPLLRVLCGGVHILDFFTSLPSLYDKVLPQEWRDFFAQHDIMTILDLLLRDALSEDASVTGDGSKWRTSGVGPSVAPASLIAYIVKVRRHLLDRTPRTSQCARNRATKPTQKMARHVAVGMTVKKIQEVGPFAAYIDNLVRSIDESSTPTINGNHSETENESKSITHLVDFGSGQNYLGRALASEPYLRNIVAIESKQANAERAKEFDIMAKLVEKQKIKRNKKLFRIEQEQIASVSSTNSSSPSSALPTPPIETGSDPVFLAPYELPSIVGQVQYIQHRITDGDLRPVTAQIVPPAMPNTANTTISTQPNLLVISLHSCGNLVHHGLRSLTTDPAVRAVAMVGCCYNLLTERLGPASYKLPSLRPTTHDHQRLASTGTACDPHGFPMSRRLCEYDSSTIPPSPSTTPITTTPTTSTTSSPSDSQRGIRLNITARMMAVQAPLNWGETDSSDFFTRHFYRALLQRVFLDRGVVGPPSPDCVGGASPAGHSSGGTPIVIGGLRKACYGSFRAYVRGALAKLCGGEDRERAEWFESRMGDVSDAELDAYEREYAPRKKELSVMWSLMAFSAGVVEATIVVDRWLWLMEQEVVGEAWVEPVFDYGISPRNLVVVGVKK